MFSLIKIAEEKKPGKGRKQTAEMQFAKLSRERQRHSLIIFDGRKQERMNMLQSAECLAVCPILTCHDLLNACDQQANNSNKTTIAARLCQRDKRLGEKQVKRWYDRKLKR